MTIDDETLKHKRCVNQLFPYCLCRGKQTFLKIAIKNTCDKLFSDLEKSQKYLDILANGLSEHKHNMIWFLFSPSNAKKIQKVKTPMQSLCPTKPLLPIECYKSFQPVCVSTRGANLDQPTVTHPAIVMIFKPSSNYHHHHHHHHHHHRHHHHRHHHHHLNQPTVTEWRKKVTEFQAFWTPL